MSGRLALSIFAIRPEPGLSVTRRAAQALGMEIIGVPLFEIGPLAWTPPDAGEVDAMLFGSANALRHGGPGLGAFSGKPAHVVGEATAQAARDAGFAVETVGAGGLQTVLDRLAGRELRLLRLAGEDHVSLDPPSGLTIITRIVYASSALPMPSDLERALRGGGVVMLHSAQAARHFRRECERLGIPLGRLRLAALGPRILDAAGKGWAAAGCAANPREGELLALGDQLCH
ncbi:MAG: uroporphyrinogen-III synthase [Novosphingobium sp.]